MTSYRQASTFFSFLFFFLFLSELGFLAADFFLSFSLFEQLTINGLLLVY